MNKISVALCTYNGAKFLSEQLESYVNQSRLPDELVVCDDGSTDRTPEIIKKFAQDSPFPVCFHVNEKNLGSTKNFEKAISLCTGDLIFLSDQDDVWLPQKIKRIEAEFEKDAETGMVFSDAEIVDENLRSANCNVWDFTFSKEYRAQALKGKFFDVLMSQNTVTGATMAFRADCRRIFMPIPENIPNLIHDGWISLLIANEAKTVFVEEPLIKYRQHSAQQLGIDYQTALKRDFSQRKSHYDGAIEINEREFERLEQMEKLFKEFPRFAERRKTFRFAEVIEEKKEKINHYTARRNLPQTRFKRFVPVVQELLTGRYHTFSKGFRSALKDLLGKW